VIEAPPPRRSAGSLTLGRVWVSECPLTLAVQLEGSGDLIKVLRSGGAHLDFRTRDGITALHRAVLCRNSASLSVRAALMHHGSFSVWRRGPEAAGVLLENIISLMSSHYDVFIRIA